MSSRVVDTIDSVFYRRNKFLVCRFITSSGFWCAGQTGFLKNHCSNKQYIALWQCNQAGLAYLSLHCHILRFSYGVRRVATGISSQLLWYSVRQHGRWINLFIFKDMHSIPFRMILSHVDCTDKVDFASMVSLFTVVLPSAVLSGEIDHTKIIHFWHFVLPLCMGDQINSENVTGHQFQDSSCSSAGLLLLLLIFSG